MLTPDTLPTHLAERVTVHSSSGRSNPAGSFVLYWMRTAVRAHENPALDVALAWGYVALRILHSLWQMFVNTIPIRFALFCTSAIVLLVLAVRAVMATAFANPSVLPA